MFKEFNLRILLTNSEMQTGDELAEAIGTVSAQISDRGEADDGARGIVRDINGNHVGGWQIRRTGTKGQSGDFDRIRRTVDPKAAMDALVKLAAYVGANEWNSDLCEGVIDLINYGLAGSDVQPAQRVGVSMGVDELWGPMAIELDFEHNAYEEPDDEPDGSGEADEDGEGNE
jgi:hypothetical protein